MPVGTQPDAENDTAKTPQSLTIRNMRFLTILMKYVVQQGRKIPNSECRRAGFLRQALEVWHAKTGEGVQCSGGR
jgi:hypothetical protein